MKNEIIEVLELAGPRVLLKLGRYIDSEEPAVRFFTRKGNKGKFRGNNKIRERFIDNKETLREAVFKLIKDINIDSVYFLMFYSIPLADSSLPDFTQQKNWIKNKLQKLENEKLIIAHHQPSVSDFYNNKSHIGWDEKLNSWWSNLISSYDNVEAVITGHFHRDELHWIGNTPVFVSSSVAGFWGRQASYRLYHYKNGKLSYNTIYINE